MIAPPACRFEHGVGEGDWRSSLLGKGTVHHWEPHAFPSPRTGYGHVLRMLTAASRSNPRSSQLAFLSSRQSLSACEPAVSRQTGPSRGNLGLQACQESSPASEQHGMVGVTQEFLVEVPP